MPECRELFHLWKMKPSSHSEKPVGARFGRQDPPDHGQVVPTLHLNLPRARMCLILNLLGVS